MSEKEKAKNSHIDFSRSSENVYLIQRDLKALYREEFSEALKNYNNKQKRSDRRIKDYYNHIKSSKKTALQQEMIIQVGDKDDFLDNQENTEKANEVLKAWFDGFQERNPNLKVYNAVIHNDEASPHMHLNFVPVASGYKRGLEKQVAFDRAIMQQDSTLDRDRPFDDWREKEVQLLEKLLKERGIERKHVGKNEYRDVNEFKAKQRELEQLRELDKELKEQLSHIKDTKTDMVAIENIDKRKVEKGGFMRLSEKRVELSPIDYKTLIEAGRQNVKLRKRNYELMTKAKAVKEREKILNNREQELNQRLTTVIEREKEIKLKQAKVEALYARQCDLNSLLEQSERDNKELRTENTSLKAAVSRLSDIIENLKEKVTDYQKRLRGALEGLTSVVRAVGMFKYDKGAYKANLTQKQGSLVDAVSEYGERWAKKEGFFDLAEHMEKEVGISKGIANFLPKEKQKSRDNDMSL